MSDDISLETLLEDASRIPAAPGVALELSRLCREADSSIESLVAVLKCDPALTAKILRMANSAYFASRREISSLSEAVIRLGLRRVQIMALAFCVIDATTGKGGRKDGFDYVYFWTHALVTGTFADVVSSTRRQKLAVEAFVAGLLQDIGVLVIQTAMPDRYRGVLTFREKAQEELYVTETRRLGFNHMQAGEFLLRRWHIPEAICVAVGNHHRPEVVQSQGEGVYELVRTCEAAAAVGKLLTHEGGRQQLLNGAVALAAKHFGMDRTEFQSILGLVRMKLDASAQMFEVNLDEAILRRLDAAIRDCIAERVMEFSDAPDSGN
jgi:HD-like signal output (HDOD) protein